MIEIQEGLSWKPTKYGSEIEAKEGYHFYSKQMQENYDEDGNLVSNEKRYWITFMGCVWRTIEEVNANIVCEKVNEC